MRYPNNHISIYPDASGDNRKTNAEQTDISLLKNAGFTVFANPRNPSILDRVNTVNNAFDKSRLFVNVAKCSKLTEALERQAYDPKTNLPEKLNTHPEPSDYTDSIGYLISYVMPINRPMSRIQTVGY